MNAKEIITDGTGNEAINETIMSELEQKARAALETYSNVHRGSGHYSMISTGIYEKARKIVLDFLGKPDKKYTLIFTSQLLGDKLTSEFKAGSFHSISSAEIGLPLGVMAIAVRKKGLARVAPVFTGGGNARLVARDWVIWARFPGKFEAGTPSIINIITFAKALQILEKYGLKAFNNNVIKAPVEEILYKDGMDGLPGKALLSKLQKTMTGSGNSIPLAAGGHFYVNMDNAASTPAFGPAWEVYRRCWQLDGDTQNEVIETSKRICHEFLGAPLSRYDLIYTANATEAINLAAESLMRQSGQNSEVVVLGSAMEHSSNDLPWRKQPGITQLRLGVDSDGFFDITELEDSLIDYNRHGKHGNKRIKLVALTGCSNVLGTYNNLEEISRIVHHYGALLLVDAAQMLAHRKISMKESGIDFLAFSAHKAYAPFGAGGLMAGKGLLNFNSPEMASIKKSGEENVAGIAASAKALELLKRVGLDVIRQEEQDLTARMLRSMVNIPRLRLFGMVDPDAKQFRSKGGVILFEIKGMLPGRLARELAERGAIGVRYGCHCAHIMIKKLVGVGPTLERFQAVIVGLFPKLELPGLVRASLGLENTVEDVDHFVKILQEITDKSNNKGLAKKRRELMKEYVDNSVKKIFADEIQNHQA